VTDARLRVLVVTGMYPAPDQPARGSFVRAQVEALRATGEVEVGVFAYQPSGHPWRYPVAAARLLRTPADIDLVHAHFGLSGAVSMTAPRRLPLVMTVHGTDCHHPVTRRFTALAARRAAAVVAVSSELAAHCPCEVTEIIPPGVDLGLFRPMPRTEARAALGLSPERRLVVFPSDPARAEKRFALARALVDEVRHTGPPQGAVESEGDRAQGAWLELRALAGRPHDEVPLWLNAADAVVIPSEREGYGLACVEALACDVPVLSTSVGIAPELLAGVDGTLCAPFDLGVWAAHLRRLLTDPDPRVAGRGAVESQGLEAVARRLVALYREVLSRR